MLGPRCELCWRPVPDGVTRVDWRETDGPVFCGPCLWDEYTPGWREHEAHDEPYATCTRCVYGPDDLRWPLPDEEARA